MIKSLIHSGIRLSAITFLSLLSTGTVRSQTDISGGNVSGVWTKNGSPFRISGEITVPNGETLSIEPGVEVLFTGHYKFNVQGRLLAIGNVSDTIRFTAPDPQTGWHGLRFIDTPVGNDSSKIVYCSLKYGKANTGNDLDRSGGAIAIQKFNKVLISHCLIESNMTSGSMATTGAGGIGLMFSSPTISHCEFKANTSVYGAALVVYYSSHARISNNHFHHNTGHGTINIGIGSAPLLVNNLVENNTSTPPAHGVVHFEGGSGRAVLINNTIVNNICGGGAVWMGDASSPLFINNIIAGNSPAQVRLEVPSTVSFYNCLIEGGQEGFKGSAFRGTCRDCIDSAPGFADSADFHLLDDSPCIGAGLDSVEVSGKWFVAPVMDFEGNTRPGPAGSNPDIGAYESGLGGPVTGIREAASLSPDGFELFQNYPNPFNPATVVSYELKEASDVRLTVLDVRGREVAVPEEGKRAAGIHRVTFDGSRLASGVYFCRLQAGSRTFVGKMMLIK